ncbi:SIR2 family protein [Leptospira sp. B5-022]|uniref:SIR2 family protein n=1 Tax=Leptospira sp. B5-022 TaxID=1242992 RepID=UPI0002C032BF|nr:SIR2 family protein [Leptospira sp. B5-022]EMK02343.1 SIR2-like domain protein [Leptospira sp. B5-022]
MGEKLISDVDNLVPGSSVTFFLGSGFSKAWDKTFPNSEELFTIPSTLFNELSYLPSLFFSNSKWESFKDGISFKELREIVYEISMYLRYPETRPSYIDRNNASFLLSEIKNVVRRNFSQKAEYYKVHGNNDKFYHEKPLEQNQNKIIKFFKEILKSHVVDEPIVANNIKFNIFTTNYDSVVELILDKIYPGPIFNLLYRGITPSIINGKYQYSRMIGSQYLINLFKINGGFEIFKSDENYILDYSDVADLKFNNTPLIMLPSKEQDYNEDYFKQLFQKTVQMFKETDILIVIGYSFSEEDALLRFLLRQFAEGYHDLARKKVYYIDFSDAQVMRRKLVTVFPQLMIQPPSNIEISSKGFISWLDS